MCITFAASKSTTASIHIVHFRLKLRSFVVNDDGGHPEETRGVRSKASAYEIWASKHKVVGPPQN